LLQTDRQRMAVTRQADSSKRPRLRTTTK
jgi:hypothetical protein